MFERHRITAENALRALTERFTVDELIEAIARLATITKGA